MNHVRSTIMQMRDEAQRELDIATNHFNYADSKFSIDKAIYRIDLAEKKLDYSIKLCDYLRHSACGFITQKDVRNNRQPPSLWQKIWRRI